MRGAAYARGLEDFVVDGVAEQGGAHQGVVVFAKNLVEGGDVAATPAGDPFRIKAQAAGGAAADALDFVLLVNYRGAPGFAVVQE